LDAGSRVLAPRLPAVGCRRPQSVKPVFFGRANERDDLALVAAVDTEVFADKDLQVGTSMRVGERWKRVNASRWFHEGAVGRALPDAR